MQQWLYNVWIIHLLIPRTGVKNPRTDISLRGFLFEGRSD